MRCLKCNTEVTDDMLRKAGYIKVDEGDVREILNIVILGALELKINKEENKALVFTCCGKPDKPIETRGLCPHCNNENVEVVNLWKYNLALAIIQAGYIRKDSINSELLEACQTAREYLRFNKGNGSVVFDKLEQAITKAEEGI